jgi:hypothetical protein
VICLKTKLSFAHQMFTTCKFNSIQKMQLSLTTRRTERTDLHGKGRKRIIRMGTQPNVERISRRYRVFFGFWKGRISFYLWPSKLLVRTQFSRDDSCTCLQTRMNPLLDHLISPKLCDRFTLTRRDCCKSVFYA